MSLIAVSVSHKTADVAFRERFAFTKKKQHEIIRQILENKYAGECVLISTCNRTEFYLTDVRDEFFGYLSSVADVEYDRMCAHMNVYEREAAVEHLFELAAGLDSMVVGEDQILGQVKDAHAMSLEENTSGECLNVLFRLAVTAAKKVKTETELSRTPVSIASLAIKACGEYLGGLSGKNVMVIGASGKLGSIVVKDLLALDGVKVYATARTYPSEINGEITDGVHIISYAERYDHVGEMDAVISATSSPHYVLETRLIPTNRRRIFADLAVPKDILADSSTAFSYINIDDFEKIAQSNNEKKLVEAKKARDIMQKFIDEFYTRRILTKKKKTLDMIYKKVSDKFGNDAVKPIKYTVYKVKAACRPSELEAYIGCLENAFELYDNFEEGTGK